MAVGATHAEVLRLVFGRALRLVAIGVSIGLAGTIAGRSVLEKLLYGVGPGDPVLLAAAVGAVVATSALAAWLPARRAARVDPATALRTE
jgi:ABC-type antimicrobial peptide transport system permease subunit